MWGERPFYGRMSEVRLWNVSRTESQIKENMITVDTKSEGLAAYYKQTGTDQFQDGETWKVNDASGHGMDGLVNGGDKALGIVELDEPITIKQQDSGLDMNASSCNYQLQELAFFLLPTCLYSLSFYSAN